MSALICMKLMLIINIVLSLTSAIQPSKTRRFYHQYPTPIRPLGPPFPDGACGGKIVSLSSADTYAIDTRLNGNQFLLPPRQIDVWLPPGYDQNGGDVTRHPVLVVHDGQNAMSDKKSWTGASWRLMGALTRLEERFLLRTHVPIVVLVPSAEGDLIPGMRRRHLEYADRGPFAEAHASFLAETVVPLVENRFRTSGERHVLGSSLGGQASMQLMLKYPHLFDGVACLSPYFQSGTLELVPLVAEKLRSKRIYLDIGGNLDDREVPWLDLMDHMTPENWWNPGYWWLDTQLQPAVESMKEVLETAGIPFYLHQEPGGRHNERAWAQRIDLPLLHLFGKGLKEEAETMINFN